MAGTQITRSRDLIYKKPDSLEENPFHFCPGCGHGIVFRLIAEVIDELDIRERSICVASIGCTVTAYHYFNFDGVESAHGRAPAVATGIKRCHPDLIAFTYQGDGDLAAIGTTEIVHACARGENITTIFVNNAIYGMTGGQMAPTTLIGMRSTTTTGGRKPELHGHPIRVCEMLSTLDGVAYMVRASLHNPAQVRRAKQAIKLAFRTQMSALGMSFVEILSPCPLNWRMGPVESLGWIKEHMLPQYPLGEYKVSEAVRSLKEKDDA